MTTIQNKINELVKNGQQALQDFLKLDQKQIDYIVAKCCIAGIENHTELAMQAIEETKRGVFEDKATKNLYACEYVQNYIRNIKTVGIVSQNHVSGITEVAEPLGIIVGLIPVTNPTSTTIFKSLIALKTRNPIIFAFHPSAQKCSTAAAKIIYEAAVKAGAPKNCIQWIEEPNMEATTFLMKHDNIASILATGGNSMVKAAYSSGKPALGVGAGNVPAYINKSAYLPQAVNDIVLSKTFDNGMICASEQAAIIDEEIYENIKELFIKYKAVILTPKQKQQLKEIMFKNGNLNSEIVGQSAYTIATKAKIKVPKDTSILIVECKEVGDKEVFSKEKLSPVLAFFKSKNAEEGFKISQQILELGGLGHSAAIHCKNQEMADEYGKYCQAIRIIWNQPSSFGGIGNMYNSLVPSLTLGCGSYGNNSIAGNIGVEHLLNIKKIAKRQNRYQWFKIPNKIFFERNSIQYLKSAKNIERAFIVTDHSIIKFGMVKKIIDQLHLRKNNVKISIYAEVESDPDIKTIKDGIISLNRAKPDTIIALGGGSVMDAAKAMWLFYEHPEVNFDDLKQKFIDIRKRAFRYPQLGEKAKLICIPTTCGTGSEVTPFAVISDKENNKKYPLTDYSLTPSVAIIDPEFINGLPTTTLVNTALDTLTHAIEAYVSVMANDYTDGLALHAIKMVFKYLPLAFKDPSNEFAKEKLHNAATIAGMAFANSFLGIDHGMSHQVGAYFHLHHGLTCGILLPHTIRYNGTTPSKLSIWPKYNIYNADKKYQEICDYLHIDTTVEQSAENLASAVENLMKEVEAPTTFEQAGIKKEEYFEKIDTLTLLSYKDQCATCNPRVPLFKDIKEILIKAYK